MVGECAGIMAFQCRGVWERKEEEGRVEKKHCLNRLRDFGNFLKAPLAPPLYRLRRQNLGKEKSCVETGAGRVRCAGLVVLGVGV